MENDKYVVFKRENVRFQWDGDQEHPTIASIEAHQVIPDAVVIRRQDIFAGPGLFAYANAIQTAIDLVGEGMTGPHPYKERLEELRDFFWEQAMMASHAEHKKIPD